MKNLKLINFCLFFILLVILGMNYMTGADFSKRNYNIFTEMADSVAYESFSENPNFADGKTQRPPIKGTIARGQLPLTVKDGKDGYENAGVHLKSPFDPNDKNFSNVVARGENVFRNMCSACHGFTGLGDGGVVKKGFPAPPSLFEDKVMNLQDGHIYHAITFGKGNMASQALQVPRNDRWKVIAYIRDLQRREMKKRERAKLKAEALKKKENEKPGNTENPEKQENKNDSVPESGKEGA